MTSVEPPMSALLPAFAGVLLAVTEMSMQIRPRIQACR